MPAYARIQAQGRAKQEDERRDADEALQRCADGRLRELRPDDLELSHVLDLEDRCRAEAPLPPPAPREPQEFVPARIPNYLARADDPSMQTPLTPDASQAYAATADGVEIELFASEPDLRAPLAPTPSRA